MKLLILLTLLTLGCTVPFTKTEVNRDLASEDDYSQAEIHLGKLISNTVSVYVQGKYSIDIANSVDSIQFTISYEEADRESLFGPAGIRKRNLQVLLNEQFLAWQEKEAEKEGHFFVNEESKRVLVKFNEQ